MVAMLTGGHDDGQGLIEVETDQPSIECARCKIPQLEAVYWKNTSDGWRLMRICASCRYWEQGEEDKRLILAESARAGELSRDPLLASAPRAYREDGQLRCKECKSTVYREVSLVRGRGSTAMYVTETLCWMAGHVLQAVWKRGSPVRGRFPTSETAPTLAEPVTKKSARSLILVEKAEPMAVRIPEAAARARAPMNTINGVKPVSMRRIIQVQEPSVEGCDERCETFRYIEPDDVNGPVYVRTQHSAAAHNMYNAEGITGQLVYEWSGLKLDFETMTLYVEGREAEHQPTVKEWKILRLLADNNGSMVTQTKLLSVCWGPEYADEQHLLRVNMARLRPKLAKDAERNPNRFIVTRTGLGYMMRPALRQAKIRLAQ